MDIARFAADQARKNVSTMAAFATCRSPMDFLEIWRKAATDAVADYADEAARFLNAPRVKRTGAAPLKRN